MHPTLPQVNTGDIYFMLSRKSVKKSTLNDLKKAYEEMQKDGTIERISKKYSEMFGIKQW